MANSAKDTIYVDIDDEITGVIDKVQSSKANLVALVLPKRASVFQSIVNMKLLKRAADAGKKNIVLITSEAGLLPLAGAAGVYVAKTLNTKPEIPLAPSSIIDGDEPVDEDAPLSVEPESPLDDNQTVGELAEHSAPKSSKAQDLETVTLDNAEPETKADADNSGTKAKAKKDKSLKVPNFNRFRLIFGIIILVLILLIGGFIFLSSSFAKATINISTNSTNIPVSLNLKLSTAASSVSTASDTLPAQYAQTQKTFSEQVATTGQKNEGTKATGSVTMTSTVCNPSNPLTPPSSVAAGTGVSNNNQTYITQETTTFTIVGAKQSSGNTSCYVYPATNSTDITAQSGGSSYNVSGVSFTVAGRSDITASGSTSGGTDNMVQIVNQNDINNAQNKISTGNSAGVEASLQSQLKGQGYYPIKATFTDGTPTVTPSASVGSATNTVTVTETINYGMFGVYKSDLQTLIANSVNNQINTSTQSILDYGLSSANYNVTSQTATKAVVTMNTTAIAGSHLDIAKIKQQSAGKKEQDIKSAIMTNANVTGVKVSFSPFWASSAPSNTAKITVVVAKPTNK